MVTMPYGWKNAGSHSAALPWPRVLRRSLPLPALPNACEGIMSLDQILGLAVVVCFGMAFMFMIILACAGD